MTVDDYEIVRLAGWAERGHLPREGGLERQQNRQMRLIEIAMSEINDGVEEAYKQKPKK